MTKPTKMRNKQIYKATYKMRSSQVSANLSKGLQSKYKKRSIRVIEGDNVTVKRGEYVNISGKIEKVDTASGRVGISNISHENAKGDKIDVMIHVSNLLVIGLNLKDTRRRNKIGATEEYAVDETIKTGAGTAGTSNEEEVFDEKDEEITYDDDEDELEGLEDDEDELEGLEEDEDEDELEDDEDELEELEEDEDEDELEGLEDDEDEDELEDDEDELEDDEDELEGLEENEDEDELFREEDEGEDEEKDDGDYNSSNNETKGTDDDKMSDEKDKPPEYTSVQNQTFNKELQADKTEPNRSESDR